MLDLCARGAYGPSLSLKRLDAFVPVLIISLVWFMLPTGAIVIIAPQHSRTAAQHSQEIVLHVILSLTMRQALLAQNARTQTHCGLQRVDHGGQQRESRSAARHAPPALFPYFSCTSGSWPLRRTWLAREVATLSVLDVMVTPRASAHSLSRHASGLPMVSDLTIPYGAARKSAHAHQLRTRRRPLDHVHGIPP